MFRYESFVDCSRIIAHSLSLQVVMQASSEYKISAVLKGSAVTVQRLFDSLRPVRASLTPEALRDRWYDLQAQSWFARWMNPHAWLSRAASRKIAIAIALSSALIAVTTRTDFDGVLDVHGRVPRGVVSLCLDLAVSWMLTAGALWAAALISDRSIGEFSDERNEARPSLRDFVIAVGVARTPTLLIALLVALMPQPQMWAESLLRGALLLPLFLWFAAMLYTGFQQLSGLRGQASAIPFLAGMVTAEAIAKAYFGG